MRDIATACGVSHTTVSFVLRGREMGISKATRMQILRQAIALDYQTRADQRIDAQKTRVLFLLPEYDAVYGDDRYYGRLLSYLCSQEEQTGVQIQVQGSDERDIVRALYRGICQDRVDIVMPIALSPEEMDVVVELSPVPVVCTDLWANPRCSRIGFSEKWIGAEAARRFYAAGHRRFGAVVQDDYLSERLAAFLEQGKELGCATELVNCGQAGLDAIRPGIRAAIRNGFDFTALFCSNDTIALIAMQALHEEGVGMPEEVSLIGCDDHHFARYAHPALSTFRLDEVMHGKQLLNEFQRLGSGEHGSIYIENKAEFIQRQSVQGATVEPASLETAEKLPVS